MMKNGLVFYSVMVFTIISILFACRDVHFFRTTYNDVNAFLHDPKNISQDPFLKIHLKNGEVCMYEDQWTFNESDSSFSGLAKRFNLQRKLIDTGEIRVGVHEIALYETNSSLEHTRNKGLAVLGVLAGIDVAITTMCLISPKTCYGSCPTFYYGRDDHIHFARAEGFSNAVVPAMEYADIDALDTIVNGGNAFKIVMKNEALETHAIRSIKLHAFPVEEDEKVFHSPNNQFFKCKNTYKPLVTDASDLDQLSKISNKDLVEYFSLADENNLLSKEEMIISFPETSSLKTLGLIGTFRQTMMSTFLFYTSMGYMGNEVSDFFAQLETDPDLREQINSTIDLLGGIEVYLWDENDWSFQGKWYETGPIAFNDQIIPLNRKTENPKIKLVFNKGLWRIDQIALAEIEDQVFPRTLEPTEVYKNHVLSPQSLSELSNPKQHLASMPGNQFDLMFEFPKDDVNYMLFLESEGYYLEWMRKDWLEDKDLIQLAKVIYTPKLYLREIAKEYKSYENHMEEAFWNSKLDTDKFDHYDN